MNDSLNDKLTSLATPWGLWEQEKHLEFGKMTGKTSRVVISFTRLVFALVRTGNIDDASHSELSSWGTMGCSLVYTKHSTRCCQCLNIQDVGMLEQDEAGPVLCALQPLSSFPRNVEEASGKESESTEGAHLPWGTGP